MRIIISVTNIILQFYDKSMYIFQNWTYGLCQMDSDNDGRRNGEELSDPWCEWTPRSGDNLPLPQSHPGICDSSGSPCSNGEVTQFSCPSQSDVSNQLLDPFNNLVFQPPPLPGQEQRNPDELINIPNFQFLGRTLRQNQRPEPPPELEPAPTPPPPPPPTPIPSVIHKRVRTQAVETPLLEPANTNIPQNDNPSSDFNPFIPVAVAPEPKSPGPIPPLIPPSVMSQPEVPNRPAPINPLSLGTGARISLPQSGTNSNTSPLQNNPPGSKSPPFSQTNNVPHETPPIPPGPLGSSISIPNVTPAPPTPSPPVNQVPNSNINPILFPPILTVPSVNIPTPNIPANTIPASPLTTSSSAITNNQSRVGNIRPNTRTAPQRTANNGNSRFAVFNNNIPLALRRRPSPVRNQNNLQLQLRNQFSRQDVNTLNVNNNSPVFPRRTMNRPNPLSAPRQSPRIPFPRTPFIRPNQNIGRNFQRFPNTQAPFPMIPRNQSAVMGFRQRNTSPRQNPFQRFNVQTQNRQTPAVTTPQQTRNSNQRQTSTVNQRPRFLVQQVRRPQRAPSSEDPSLFVIRTLRRVMRPNFTCPGLNGPNTYQWMLRLPRVQIPTRFQSGVCMVFNLPTNGDFHLIGGTPVIDNRDAVQQMFVYGCDEGTTVPVTLRPYACDGMPRRECQNIIGGYGGSIPGICFPRTGGIRIGGTGFKQIILQVRWTNLFGRFGMTDSSGMSIYYTNSLRQYDIGTKVLRATHFTIPPGQPEHTVTSTCPGECTVMQIRSPIYITMAFNHMHLLGRREKVELVRNGEILDLITDEDAFSYDDPKAYWHQNPIQILPGDSLRMSCVYNSMSMRSNVSWGFGEADEICLATLFYYPKESWETTSCTSFRSIPLCKLETTGIVNDCDFNSFFSTLRRDFQTAAALANCTMRRICNEGCFSLSVAARSHPCLMGDSFKLLESSIDISPDERLSVLFETLKLCEPGIHGVDPTAPVSNALIPTNLLPDVETVKNMIDNNLVIGPSFPTLAPLVTVPPMPRFTPRPTPLPHVPRMPPLATPRPSLPRIPSLPTPRPSLPRIPPLPTPLPPPTSTTASGIEPKKATDETESVVKTSGDTRIKIIPINRNNKEESVQSTMIRLIQDHFRTVPISIVVISPDGLLRVENQIGLSNSNDP
ncbi:uncharacterized protein [Argopecten irradians]|uniref:uncharacterized protein n=1 Tax=Argopecten irradians TaxID=31199 RepID=UPI00371F4E64